MLDSDASGTKHNIAWDMAIGGSSFSYDVYVILSLSGIAA